MVGHTSEVDMGAVRETWVFPGNGEEPYLKGTRERSVSSAGFVILPDLPDFVSPIDQKRYSGRAGLREHCKRHDVVPNADLKGLPMLTAQSDQRTPEQRRASMEHRKQTIIHEVNRHYQG